MAAVSWFDVQRWDFYTGSEETGVREELCRIANRARTSDTPVPHLLDIWEASLVAQADATSEFPVKFMGLELSGDEATVRIYASGPKLRAAIYGRRLKAKKRLQELDDLFARSFRGDPTDIFQAIEGDVDHSLVLHCQQTLGRQLAASEQQLVQSFLHPSTMLKIWQSALEKELKYLDDHAPKRGAQADIEATAVIQQAGLGWILLQLDKGLSLGDSVPNSTNGGKTFCGDMFELCTDRKLSDSVLNKRMTEFRNWLPSLFDQVLTENEKSSWLNATAEDMAACRIADTYRNFIPLFDGASISDILRIKLTLIDHNVGHPPHVERYLKRREEYFQGMRRLRSRDA